MKDPLPLARPKKPNLELLIYPYFETLEAIPNKEMLYSELNSFLNSCPEGSTIAILSSPIFAADFCSLSRNNAHLKLWIAVKHLSHGVLEGTLEQSHSALLILTKYKTALKHTRTRIAYTYCPVCEKGRMLKS